MMKGLVQFLSTAALLACLELGAPAFAQGNPSSSLTTMPHPAPADQEFAAILHIHVNPAAQAFWGEERPQNVINGNQITFLFDTGCGWLCPPYEPTAMAYPFTMPALPAGTYVIRFANALEAPSEVYAQFTLNVGLGGITSTALPVGGTASAGLGLLIVLFGWKRLRMRGAVKARNI